MTGTLLMAGCTRWPPKEPVPAQETSPEAGALTLETAEEPASAEVIKIIVLSDRKPDDCNVPRPLSDASDPEHHASLMADGNISFWGDAYVSAEVSAPTEDNFEVRWYIGETASNPQSSEDFETGGEMGRYVTQWEPFSSEQDIHVSEGCDGKKYVHVKTPSLESGFGVMGTWLSPRKIEFLLNGSVVKSQLFYFQQ